MTRRETMLLRILSVTALSAVVLFAAQLYLDELTRLDKKYISLQKEASQIQLQLVSAPSAKSGPDYRKRFWLSGELPKPLELARIIKPVLDGNGVLVKDFQVANVTPQNFVLKYSLEGTAQALLRTLSALRKDPKLIIHSFSAVFQERGIYRCEWEVGYAAIP